jgi:beta-galactosidase
MPLLTSVLHSHYIPFGSQYYRAPSPHPDQWERDLQKLASLGFNMVKFWVQWRWNNPDEGKFDFPDIDRLMDFAHESRLRVMLNTIVDVAPAWVYRNYPDASMVTLDGRRIGPQTQPHRQIGGLGVCFNHPQAMRHMLEFLRVTVERYKDHPALEIWNVGSEPELTSSMSELRLYAADASRMGDMLCYCDHCSAAFIEWLHGKYGTVEALNESWNRNYRSFDDVELPRTRNTFNDMIDWRMFFVHTLGENVKRRFEVARGVDQGNHPLMCHHVFIQGFPVTSTASDPWNVGQHGDLHGFTQMDDPMMADILRSCAKGRPVISAEMLMLYGYTLDLPKPIDESDLKRFIFTGVAANLKGFVFWQYRPEILGREAPAWGLTRLDGSSTPWLEAFADVNAVLQRNKGLLLDAEPKAAEVAILYNPENQVFAWEATGNEMTATDSLRGTHKALYEHNFNVDFIHPREFESDVLKNYRVLFVPFPYCLSESICRKIEDWVGEGGTVIGESYFAGWNRERGHHATTVPGYGLHKMFKARQVDAVPVAGGEFADIIVKKNLPFIKKGKAVRGALVREVLVSDGAEVLATFTDESPAVTRASYGKGHAVLIGSYVGMPAQRNDIRTNADLIASLAAMHATASRPSASPARVRVDVLTSSKKERMVILRNLDHKFVKARIHLPFGNVKVMLEEFSGKRLPLQHAGGGAVATVSLRGREVRVYRA